MLGVMLSQAVLPRSKLKIHWIQWECLFTTEATENLLLVKIAFCRSPEGRATGTVLEKSMVFWIIPGLVSQICHLIAVWPWTCYSTSHNQLHLQHNTYLVRVVVHSKRKTI